MSSSFLEVPAPLAEDVQLARSPLLDPESPGPIRAELLGLEGLENEARRLAKACALAPERRASSPLLRRFVENERVLMRAHRAILVQGRQQIHGIDAEWLADNFHIVEEVLREVRRTCRSGYDAELPKLAGRPARAAIPASTRWPWRWSPTPTASSTRRGSPGSSQAFQEVAPLTIGELWAVPTMLRLVLLENLRRLAEQMLWGWDERQPRRALGRPRLLAAGIARPKRGLGRASDRPRRASPPSPTRPTLRRPAAAAPARPGTVGGRRCAATGSRPQLEARRRDANEVLRREHRRQAANQVSVGNCVISLRLLSAIDWNAFFEETAARSRRSSATTRPASTQGRTSPPATATAGPSRRSPGGAKADERGRRPPGGRARP